MCVTTVYVFHNNRYTTDIDIHKLRISGVRTEWHLLKLKMCIFTVN